MFFSVLDGYMMDDFELSFGYWQQYEETENFQTAQWTLQQGQSINLLYGPRRDHTFGTHLGESFSQIKSLTNYIFSSFC